MTKKFRQLVIASAAIAATIGLFIQADPSQAKVTKPTAKTKANGSLGWQINYFPGQVTAASTVYLAGNAVKIVTEGSYEIIAKAPSWSATVTNMKTKRSCELTSSRWIKEGFFLDPPDAKEYMNPKRADTTEHLNYRGLKAQKRVWITIESDALYRYRTKPQRCAIELISTNGAIPCSPMQRELLSVWYGIPSLEGVPLFWQNVMEGNRSQRLKVANVQRVTLGPENFVPLKGTKREASMLKLVDSKYRTALTDFIEMDGASYPTAKTIKPKSNSDK
jgi:hypothetical protein